MQEIVAETIILVTGVLAVELDRLYVVLVAFVTALLLRQQSQRTFLGEEVRILDVQL